MADSRIEALGQALKMEEDGKAYYEEALNRVESKLAKEVCVRGLTATPWRKWLAWATSIWLSPISFQERNANNTCSR